jgi:hypothetical protein
MRSWLRPATAIAAVTAIGFALPAAAQKSGGILKMYDPDSPPTMSIPRGGDHRVAGADDGGLQ